MNFNNENLLRMKTGAEHKKSHFDQISMSFQCKFEIEPFLF